MNQNPYHVIFPTGSYPFTHYLFYPLTCAFIGIPFLPFNDYLAGAIFFGISSSLLAFALSKEYWRLLIFLSAPFYVALFTAQWSPLMAVGAFLPGFHILASCKPNLGFLSFVYNPSRKGVIYALILILISVIILPIWPFDWLDVMLTKMPSHPFPFMVGLAPILVISIFFLKSKEGRLLFASTILPQAFFFYDQFILLLVSKNIKELLLQVVFSWVGFFGWKIFLNGAPDTGQHVPAAHWYVVLFIFYPALIVLIYPKLLHIVKSFMIELTK